MKHKARQRRPPKPPSTRRKREPGELLEDERVCAWCDRTFKLGPGTHVVPALWGGPDAASTAPTVYFCATPCFEAWTAEHRPRKIVHKAEPMTRLPKMEGGTPLPGFDVT